MKTPIPIKNFVFVALVSFVWFQEIVGQYYKRLHTNLNRAGEAPTAELILGGRLTAKWEDSGFFPKFEWGDNCKHEYLDLENAYQNPADGELTVQTFRLFNPKVTKDKTTDLDTVFRKNEEGELQNMYFFEPTTAKHIKLRLLAHTTKGCKLCNQRELSHASRS